MCRARILIIPFLLVFWLSAGGVVLGDSSPMDQLKVTVDKVLELLRDKSLPKQEKKEKVASLVRDRFNFQAMSQGVLGVNWRRATPEQRERFVELFSDLLEKTYSGRIDAYSGETVKFGEQRIQDNRAEVDTSISDQNKDIPINYKLLKQGDKWLVYDVKIEGVSLILNYRNTYAEIIQKDGIDSLLKQMADKVEELKNSGEAEPKQ